MPNRIISLVIILSSALFGALMGHYVLADPLGMVLSLGAGVILGVICVLLVRTWLNLDAQRIVGGAAGLMVGALFGLIVIWGIWDPVRAPQISAILSALLMVLFSLIGMQLGAVKAKELYRKPVSAPSEASGIAGILDTSVIIDGRIADVCETGFVNGNLVIPQFVLKELQTIADSPEATKRTRGRRGLDILNKIQKQSYVSIIIDETDYPSIKDVDQKLIQMAKDKGYSIITNDYNLNKVAEVHSLSVLNINRLANALKPIVLPGETMKVQVIKEGKEPGQGVAYLDDGTMVVIDNGRRYMGKNLEVTVTSVLQTTAGRMIFAAVRN